MKGGDKKEPLKLIHNCKSYTYFKKYFKNLWKKRYEVDLQINWSFGYDVIEFVK